MQASRRGRSFNVTPIQNPQSFLPHAFEQQDSIPDTPLPYQTFSESHSPTQRSRNSTASTPSHAIRHPYHDPTATIRRSPERDTPRHRDLSQVYWSPKHNATTYPPIEYQNARLNAIGAALYDDYWRSIYLQGHPYLNSAGMDTPIAAEPQSPHAQHSSLQECSVFARQQIDHLEQRRQTVLLSQRASTSRLAVLNAQLDDLLSAASDLDEEGVEWVQRELEGLERLHNNYGHMWDSMARQMEELWAQMLCPDGDNCGRDELLWV